MKKTIFIIISTIVAALILFVSLNFYFFSKSKNDCIKKNTKDKYSFSIEFSLGVNQSDTDNFALKIKKIPKVNNVVIENKDEALRRFIKENDKLLIRESIDEIGVNPFASSIAMELDVSSADEFIETTENILDQAKKSKLDVAHHNSADIMYLRAVEGLRETPVLKEFIIFIFSDEKINFFENNYYMICG